MTRGRQLRRLAPGVDIGLFSRTFAQTERAGGGDSTNGRPDSVPRAIEGDRASLGPIDRIGGEVDPSEELRNLSTGPPRLGVCYLRQLTSSRASDRGRQCDSAGRGRHDSRHV